MRDSSEVDCPTLVNEMAKRCGASGPTTSNRPMDVMRP